MADPTLNAPASITVDEDSSDVTISGLSVDDADGDTLTVTISTAGTLSLSQVNGLSFTTGDGTDDSSMVFSGSIADINTALTGITFTAVPGENPGDTIAISVSDGGADLGSPVSYDESIDGDLSDDRFNPPSFTLGEGTNTFTASQQSNPRDIDYFTIVIPDGAQLTQLFLADYIADSFNQAFLGLQEGATFTENPNSASASNLLGGIVYGASEEGQDILDDIGNLGGAIGFDGPLSAGTYTFWLNQTSAPSTATFELVVEALGTTVEDSITVNVTPVNDAPTLLGDAALTGNEGARILLTTADVSASDPDNTPAELVYSVTSEINGEIRVDGNASSSFTQADLFAGLVTFAHDFTTSVDGSFDVQLSDGELSTSVQSVSVSITGPIVLTGTAGNDTLSSNDDANYIISGDGGNDTITGGFGIDILDGGTGRDILTGNGADDIITGGSGDDTLIGNDGDDDLSGNGNNDDLFGNAGNDTLSGGGGRDLLEGDIGNDLLIGGDGADTLNGGNGDDDLQGRRGSDEINGGVGDDTIRGNGLVDQISGGQGNDVILGGGGSDIINGDEGNDVIIAGAGNDVVDGGSGDDDLTGRSGDDILSGGAGNDTLTGSKGSDTFVFANGHEQAEVTDFRDDEDALDLTAFSFVSVSEATALMAELSGNVVFVSGGDTLTINNITIAALEDDILI